MRSYKLPLKGCQRPGTFVYADGAIVVAFVKTMWSALAYVQVANFLESRVIELTTMLFLKLAKLVLKAFLVEQILFRFS